MLRARGRARDRLVTAALDAGLPAPRGVVVTGLHGGVGQSTVTALIAAAWAAHGVAAAVLDVSGRSTAALAARLGGGADTLSWAEASTHGPAVLDGSSSAGRPLVISGPLGTSAAVLGAAVNTLAGTRRLVLIDAAPGPIGATVAAWQPSLLLVCVRADPTDIRELADALRTAAPGCQPAATVAAIIAHRPRWPRPAASAQACLTDATAGAVRVGYDARLALRGAAVSHLKVPASARLLAAAVTLTHEA